MARISTRAFLLLLRGCFSLFGSSPTEENNRLEDADFVVDGSHVLRCVVSEALRPSPRTGDRAICATVLNP